MGERVRKAGGREKEEEKREEERKERRKRERTRKGKNDEDRRREGRKRGKKEGMEGEGKVYLKIKVNEGLLYNLLSCGGGCNGNVDLPDGCFQ